MIKTASWSTEMVRDLIMCLQNNKTILSYNGIDFDTDRPLQYREIWKSMAKLYEEVNQHSLVHLWFLFQKFQYKSY